jgi:hypothetical protein
VAQEVMVDDAVVMELLPLHLRALEPERVHNACVLYVYDVHKHYHVDAYDSIFCLYRNPCHGQIHQA